MSFNSPACTAPRVREAAFSLIEVMVAVGVLGMMLASLYAGYFFGFEQVRLSREEVRATQILEERMEVIRLFNWDQVVNMPGFIPTNFSAPFSSATPTNSTTNGLIYTGKVVVTNAPIIESYSNDLRLIQLEVTWPSGRVVRKRQMTTLVGQYGIQRYAY